MKAIWVYENTTGLESFYSRFNITLFVTSVALWKKYHPTHKTHIYLDSWTYDIFSKLDILYLWDKVDLLEYPERINRYFLWSGCKSKIISQATEPFAMIDHDFLIFQNIDEHLDDSVIYTYDEDMESWYIDPRDKFNQQITNPIEFIQDRAANVSFLYIPDPSFAKRYGERVLQNHIEFTELLGDNIHTGYMTISEQFMLKDWLVKEERKHKTLSKNLFSCDKIEFRNETTDIGIWDLNEAGRAYKHYGLIKRDVLDNRNNMYYDTMSFLYRCINASRLIDVNYLDNKLHTHIKGK